MEQKTIRVLVVSVVVVLVVISMAYVIHISTEAAAALGAAGAASAAAAAASRRRRTGAQVAQARTESVRVERRLELVADEAATAVDRAHASLEGLSAEEKAALGDTLLGGREET
jgi:TRAP-type mannitol/chloroaromatic compound transport system permease large subunit